MSTPSSKGTFGHRRSQRGELPLSKRYLVPGRRRAMLLVGLALGLVAVLLVLADMRWDGGDALSGGPLSSAHATLERSCSSCHGGRFERVADTSCIECHESSRAAGLSQEAGRPGIFAFKAHAELRKQVDRVRMIDPLVVPPHADPACADCHGEHGGRQASLVAIPDSQCLTCHQEHGFDRDHPDFAFTRRPGSDDDDVHFAHGQHVKEVLKRTGWNDPERTCLTCHQPTDDVRGFVAIDYDLHCAACHLGTGVATTRLPVDSEDGEPGVWTLERIRASGRPGTDWSFYAAPTDFRPGGRRVVKLRLEHEDPWILFNLRRLRQLRYGDAGVADLLVTAPAASSEERAVYERAVASLEAQAEALRGSLDPAVQSDLAWIEEQLVDIRRQLQDPATRLADVDLPNASTANAPEYPLEWREAWDELVADLSAPCSNCHRMDRATIQTIESDQRVLTSAEFDHAPHVTERGCLDCHGALPIREALESDDLDSLDDRAAIHNLPGIATCRECHGHEQVASSCVDCHTFHPDAASRRSARLVHFGEADLRESASLTGGRP